jgi:hypothetical protein
MVPVADLVTGSSFYIPIRQERTRQARCLPRGQTLLRYVDRVDLLRVKAKIKIAS